MKITMDVNTRQALAKLNFLGPEVEAMARRQVDMSATAILTGAKAMAPVDTGNLRSGISKRTLEQGMAAEVFNNVEYAPYVEFGTHKMAAQPHMFPALEAERARFIAGIEQGAKDVAKHA